VTGVEGARFATGEALRAEVFEQRLLERLRGPGDDHVRVATLAEAGGGGDGGGPARLRAPHLGDDAAHAEGARDGAAVGREQRRLPRCAVRQAIGDGEAAGIATRPGPQFDRRRIQGDGDPRSRKCASCEDVGVGPVAGDGGGEGRASPGVEVAACELARGGSYTRRPGAVELTAP
jgi:hypothetical protein